MRMSAPSIWLPLLTALALGAWAQDAQDIRRPATPVGKPVAQPAQPPVAKPVSTPLRTTPPPVRPPAVLTTRPAASRPADDPAAGLSTRDRELVRLVQIEIAAQVRQMRTGNARQRDRAGKSILNLHRQILLPLIAAQEKTKILSTRDLQRVLTEWAWDLRLARLGAELDAESVARLRKLRSAKPDIFAHLIAADPAVQVVGFHKLQAWPDPDRLAEPLMLRALRDMNPLLVQQAVVLMQKDRYRSQDALEGLLEAYDGRAMAVRYEPPETVLFSLRMQMLPVLGKFDDPRVEPILLQGLLQRYGTSRAVALADELARRGARGAVAAIMDSITDSDLLVLTRTTGGGVTSTYASADPLLYAVLMLTDQDTYDYGLAVPRNNKGVLLQIGFEDLQARQAAVEQLRTWWAENRNKPPYSTTDPITPYTLPTLPSSPPRPDVNQAEWGVKQ